MFKRFVTKVQVIILFIVSLTDSPGEDTIGIKITTSGDRARVWVQVLDRHDGSFIVRYRLFGSYDDLTIEVLYKDKHVAKSPYVFKGQYIGCYTGKTFLSL